MTAEKAPPKRRIPKIKDIKKPLAIGGITATLGVAGIIIGFFIISELEEQQTESEVVFIHGKEHLPNDIDPLEVWDVYEVEIIEQVAEGLFDIDITSPNSEIIEGLAIKGTWSPDSINLTCTLRQGVKFHDGTPFNAAAVKWNFDRIYRFRDNLSYGELWHLPDDKFLINQTQVLGEYSVKFVLNTPYVPFKSLLTSWTSFILSPTSTPEDDFIDPLIGDLVGTGPFTYDSYYVDDNVSMSANPNYWGGEPKIDKLIFFKGNKTDLLEGMEMGKIHLIKTENLNKSELYPFESNSSFIVHRGIPDAFVDWILMNNELINATMRKAVSYAFNYSAIIETTIDDDRRAKSPIPERTLYYNTTDINIPIYNVSYARQVLKDANWPGTASLTANANISAGNEWELVANSLTPLGAYNYSQVIMWPNKQYIGEQLVEDLKQIGVKIEIVYIPLLEYFYKVWEIPPYHRNMLNFAYNFWRGDYNDPSTYINEHYSNTSVDNWGQTYDPQVQDWMEEALTETDTIKRRNLYYDIQKRLIEEVYPSVWLRYTMRTDIHASNIGGWYPNAYRISFKSIYFKE